MIFILYFLTSCSHFLASANQQQGIAQQIHKLMLTVGKPKYLQHEIDIGLKLSKMNRTERLAVDKEYKHLYLEGLSGAIQRNFKNKLLAEFLQFSLMPPFFYEANLLKATLDAEDYDDKDVKLFEIIGTKGNKQGPEILRAYQQLFNREFFDDLEASRLKQLSYLLRKAVNSEPKIFDIGQGPSTKNLMSETVRKIHELKNDSSLMADNGKRFIDFLFDSPADLVEKVLNYYYFVTLQQTMRSRIDRQYTEDSKFSEKVKRCLMSAVQLSTSLDDKAYYAIRFSNSDAGSNVGEFYRSRASILLMDDVRKFMAPISATSMDLFQMDIGSYMNFNDNYSEVLQSFVVSARQK